MAAIKEFFNPGALSIQCDDLTLTLEKNFENLAPDKFFREINSFSGNSAQWQDRLVDVMSKMVPDCATIKRTDNSRYTLALNNRGILGFWEFEDSAE